MHCAVCKGPCPTKVLNSKAPSSVLNMFKGASGQLKSLNKILSWQESQKQSVKENQELLVQRLEEKAKQQEAELAKLEGQLEEKRVEVKSLEQAEVQLKSKLSSLGFGGPVRSLKKGSSMEIERGGKCGKPKDQVSSPARKSSEKGGSDGQGPLSSARSFLNHMFLVQCQSIQELQPPLPSC